MADGPSRKRQRQDGYSRKHNRKKFLKVTNPTVHKKALSSGLQGILFSCTPHHEDRAFRDAVLLLEKHCDHRSNSQLNPLGGGTDDQPSPIAAKAGTDSIGAGDCGNGSGDAGTDISKALEEELQDLRHPRRNLFTRVDGGVNGSVFISINDAEIDRESLVESALRNARESGSAHSRHCIRVMPIHTTCYAKKEEAAKAAVNVVKHYFPKIGEKGGSVTYAIVFRARLNEGAHRNEYIDEIAKGIEELEPRYKVNLTKPDVVLIIEVLKTSCCIGTFRHFYELAKMNLREAACPSKEKKVVEDEGTNESSRDKDTGDQLNGERADSSQRRIGESDTAAETDVVEGPQSNDKPVPDVSSKGLEENKGGEHDVGNAKEMVTVVSEAKPSSSDREIGGANCKEGAENGVRQASIQQLVENQGGADGNSVMEGATTEAVGKNASNEGIEKSDTNEKANY